MDAWDDTILQCLKTERPLNFSTIYHDDDDDDVTSSRRKVVRDPMSHRIIEKRRRDRMNNCLADLSRLIPTTYLKKGRGRIEKTEIIEMAIKHLKHLQAHSCQDPSNCEVDKTAEQDRVRQYHLGFQECMSETVRFLVETEGLYPREGVCLRLINHLHDHYDKIGKGFYPQSSTDTNLTSSESNTLHPGLDLSLCPDPIMDTVHIKRSPSPYFSVEQQEKEDFQRRESSGPEQTYSGGSSQLREMLQNPGLPLERLRSNSTSSSQSSYVGYIPPPTTLYGVAYLASKGEEVYKFKNNIKDRFHADLVGESPAGNPSEDPEGYQDHRVAKYAPVSVYGGVQSRTPRHVSQTRQGNSTTAELCVKIPEHKEIAGGNGVWDSQMDSSSSCGSNSSPNARSNSSSTSGYSTEGVYPSKKVKMQPRGTSSPVNVTMYPPVSEPPPSSDHRCPKSSSVPVFALHPKGTFYIPLTLDGALIAPYFSATDDTIPVLHPVSIAVNFSNPMKVVECSSRQWTARDLPALTERCNNRSTYTRIRSSSMVLPSNPISHKVTLVQ